MQESVEIISRICAQLGGLAEGRTLEKAAQGTDEEVRSVSSRWRGKQRREASGRLQGIMPFFQILKM